MSSFLVAPEVVVGIDTPEWYEPLAASIRAAGFFTSGIEPQEGFERTVVASKCLVPGKALGGNSFWVTNLSGQWYLGTWGCRLYRLPDAGRIAQFCIEWLTRRPSGTSVDFDEEFKPVFGLVPLDDEEFDRAVEKHRCRD